MSVRVLVLGIAVTASSTAHAVSSCSTGDAPPTHDAEVCDPYFPNLGTTGWVCSRPAGAAGFDTWECRLDVAQSGTGTITVVAEFGGQFGLYSAWGEVDGVKFCCVDDDSNIEKTNVFGTAGADTISFHHPHSTGAYNLYGAYSGRHDARVEARDGDDTIRGSDAVTDYYEDLFGESGADAIEEGDGAGRAYGGPGNDDICDSDGGGFLYGDDHDDVIYSVSSTAPTIDAGIGTDVCGPDWSHASCTYDNTLARPAACP